MNKKEQMSFNINSFLLSIADVLEYRELELLDKKPHHIKRAIFIALNIGKKLNLNSQDMSHLCSYIVLANSGLRQAELLGFGLYDKSTLKLSEDNISAFNFPKEQKNIIKYSKENFDGSGLFAIKGDNIPILSQIISFSYTIENMFNANIYDIKNRDDIVAFVKQNRDILFNKDIADIFLLLSSKVSFWLDFVCENTILQFIYTTIEDFTYYPRFEDVLKITATIDKIISSTTKNSSDNIGNFRKIGEIVTDFYGFEHKDKQTFLIASDLRNIGRLKTPYKILNKTTKLTKTELEIIKAQPYITRKTLNNILGFNDIANLASNHKECLNGKGYPFGLTGAQLSFKDRLMAVIDLYQEAIEGRPYKKPMSYDEAIVYLDNMAKQYHCIDITIVDDIKDILGKNIN